MRRLGFLVPDIAVAQSVVDDLRASAVAVASLYVVAHEGTPLGDLPDAGTIQKSDFYPQVGEGASRMPLRDNPGAPHDRQPDLRALRAPSRTDMRR